MHLAMKRKTGTIPRREMGQEYRHQQKNYAVFLNETYDCTYHLMTLSKIDAPLRAKGRA